MLCSGWLPYPWLLLMCSGGYAPPETSLGRRARFLLSEDWPSPTLGVPRSLGDFLFTAPGVPEARSFFLVNLHVLRSCVQEPLCKVRIVHGVLCVFAPFRSCVGSAPGRHTLSGSVEAFGKVPEKTHVLTA